MTDSLPPRPKARRARGLQDRRGPGLAVERELIAAICKVYEQWGFEPLETPAFEYADALGKFLPDQDRPNEGVFAFEDDDAQWLALRYDLTAPLARFVAENFDALPKPYRRWAAGPVWRNEKPGPGRFREFWQCDADTVGSASPAADAEMIAMACAALESAGVKRGGYVLKINSRLLLDGVMQAVGLDGAENARTRLAALRAIDKLDRLGGEGVIQLLGRGRTDASGDFTPGANLSEGQIDLIKSTYFLQRAVRPIAVTPDLLAQAASHGEQPFIGVEGDPSRAFPDDEATLRGWDDAIGATVAGRQGIDDLRRVLDLVRAMGVGPARAYIDSSVVRGLEYYTGAIFEAELIDDSADALAERIRFGSVGGGGRYDDLVARFRGERIPATGFSIGVSRLAAALQAQQEAQGDGPIVVLVMDPARIGDALAMAAELRAAGIRAEAYLGGGAMKAQLKYADKRGAPIAVIQGGDELAKGVVTLKDLKRGAAIAQNLGEDREAYAKAREQVQREAQRGDLVNAVREILAMKQ